MPYDAFREHRRSIRLGGYDYSRAGMYFVTICTMNHECLFGDVVGGEMHPNRFGEIVWKWWHELPNYYARVELNEFVMMPNHMHGIIVITSKSDGVESPANVGAGSSRPVPGSAPSRAVVGAASRRPSDGRTLGQLIGYLKFQITKEINRLTKTEYTKVLQRGYYEHIIRNERECNAVAEYIRSNPFNWRADLDNPANFPKNPPPKASDEYWRDAGLRGAV